MRKKFVVLQEDKCDCAAACLLSIIKYYDGYINIETIRKIIDTSKNGTNAYDLIKGSKEIGFDSYGKKVSFTEIEKEEKFFPVIAHVKRNNMYHFIVIYNINPQKQILEILDPAIGYIKETYKDFEKNYLGTLIYFSKIKDLPKYKEKNELLRILIKSLLKDKKKIILLSLISLVTFIFSLLDSYYYKIIIDNSITTEELCYKISLIFISFIIIKNLFIYLRNKLSIKINYDIETMINKETLKRLFCLPYSYYKNKSTGEIISRLNDLDTLRDLLSNLLLNTFVDILLIIISFILMFILNKKLTSIAILILLVYIIIVKIYKDKFNRNIKLIQESKGKYHQDLIENIEGMESINNLNIKNNKIAKLHETYKFISIQNKNFDFTLNRQHFLKDNVYDIGLIILVTSGFLMVINKNLSLGNLMLIYMIVNYFLTIIRTLLDKDIEISYAFKNLNKVNNFLSEETLKDSKNFILKGNIKIENIYFEYSKDSKKLIIKNLIIKENDKVLITGSSGSGKSTLIKIILKYLNNYKGTIEINGKDLKTLNEETIRESFTYIGQNEKLFTDTFKNNILLDRNIKYSDYEKVIKICELDNLKNTRKFKDDFLIEEGGFNISGGERQRIVLARALLKESNYIFIDEALSEVNLKLEKKIINNILNYYKDKTIIYISHKEKVKELFSKIYNIERRSYERY